MKLVFLHGWGFDACLWDGVRAALPEFEAVAWDRGYFGAPSAEAVAAPLIAVGHSLGAMLLAGALPEGCIGLVAINGFDRFAGEGAVPPRVVERMRRRFGEAPAEVLADFRTRCGSEPPPAIRDEAALATDLTLLAEADRRGMVRVPTLVLHGAADPLLPAPMRESVFAGAPHESLDGAGHLLPLTHADWCADRIRAFAGRLA
ncbi:alpha/beta fold hydrolase [Sphingomonas sp. PR090111-T3T-6A]|uniref:alpha/beta fold hydrolase n=1 Tax=Sphingomonas sp. PR090111-T3T-6A TaxID=685778 RepID=UPI00037AC810|nr:alpha/beta hydrolase [Sphingomonas sp. PR090111-T3T-6A]